MDSTLHSLTVPVWNVIAIVVTFCVVVGVPVFLCIWIRKKTKAKISSYFIGSLTFFVSALVLEQIFHVAVLGLSSLGQVIKNNIWLTALYGGLAAGLFEETGRFVAMKYVMKKNLNRENALMYGAGHGGIESILLVGVVYINNIIGVIMMNGGLIGSLFPGETGEQVALNLQPLATTPALDFYLGGIERVLAMILHMALSILVYKAVSQKGKMGYYVLAIALHFLVNFMTVAASHYFNLLVVELICLVGVCIAVWLAYNVWKEGKYNKA